MDAGWFSCPQCGRDLDADRSGNGDAGLRCSSGHRFEVGRRGYAALVVGKSSLVRSEPAAVLDAVDADWDSGRPGGVLAAVAGMLPSSAPLRVLDCGRDLGRLVAAARPQHPGLTALFVSSSPSAIVRTTRRSAADGVLVDPARPWPVRDGVADVVLCGFGDWRPAEFHRVLAPGGIAVIAVPEPQAGAVEDDVYPWFEHDQARAAAGPSGNTAAILRYRRRRRPLSW